MVENLRSSLNQFALANYTLKQISMFFPDDQAIDGKMFQSAVDQAMDRYSICCSNIRLKYYALDGNPVFNHLNSDQYATYLYFLSNTLHRFGVSEIAAKIYYLNKALHALDIFYEVELPDIFLISHPVGTVLGRANYNNYLVVYQNCTIGSNKGIYPVIGEGVALYKGAMIVGKCQIGENVSIAGHSLVRDQDIPANSLVFGCSPDIKIKPAKPNIKTKIFGQNS